MDRKKTGHVRFFDTLAEEKDHIFDKNNPQPVTVAVDLRGNTLLSVHKGYHFEGLGEALTPEKDYTFDGKTLTILPSFLSACPDEAYTVLSAEFDRGQSVVIPVFCTRQGVLPEYPLYRMDDPEFAFPRFDRFLEAAMETRPQFLRKGRPALRLSYDFRRTPKYYPAVCKERKRRLVHTPRPLGVAMWVYGDGSGNFLHMKLNSRDKASAYSVNVHRLTWKGWRRVLFRFDEDFLLPAIFDNILFLEYAEGGRESGTIRISDMDVICDPKALARVEEQGEPQDPDRPDAEDFYRIDYQGGTKGRTCRITVTKRDGTPPDEPVKLKILECRTKDNAPFKIKRSTLTLRKGVLHTRRFTKDEYPDDLVFFVRARDASGRVSPIMAFNCAPKESAYPKTPQTITRGITKDPARSMAFAWFTSPYVKKNVLKIWREGESEQTARRIAARPAYAREWVERVVVNHTRVDINREATQFDAEVTDLQPDTSYCCRFGGEDGWSEVYTCRTLPETMDRLDAVLMTDAQIGDVEHHYAEYAKLMEQGVGRVQAPYVMISVGDLVDAAGKQSSYARTIGAASKRFAEEIWLPTPGNHEWEHIRGFENYKSHWNLPKRGDAATDEILYTVHIGPVCFVSVPGYGGGLPMHFVEEVEKELAAAAERKPSWLVAVLHSSPYGKSGETFNPRFYVPIFEKYGVDLALCGHDHLYVRSTMWQGRRVPVGEGITYLSLGFAGPSHDRNCRFMWQDYVYGDNPAQVTKNGKVDPICSTASFTKDRIAVTVTTASGVLVDEVVLEK